MMHLRSHAPKMKVLPFQEYWSKEMVAELDQHPELWNEYKWRTEDKRSPHREACDIWLRYNAAENFDHRNPASFNMAHESVWYPSADKLPLIRQYCEVFAERKNASLGGVLITKVPPHKEIYWHKDGGWHAEVHHKYLTLLRGNYNQKFEFENEYMLSEPGETFEFDNSYPHRVTNDSHEERISLIICLKE